MKRDDFMIFIIYAGWIGIIAGLFNGASMNLMAFFALLMVLLTFFGGSDSSK